MMRSFSGFDERSQRHTRAAARGNSFVEPDHRGRKHRMTGVKVV